MTSKEKGYTLAALIVIIGVITVFVAVALPLWSRITTREREEELVFRGEAYNKAIVRFYREKGRLPLSLDELVSSRALRRLYPDPMTRDGNWDIIYYSPTGLIRGDSGKSKVKSKGIIGVASRSNRRSVRIYQGKDRYYDWLFLAVDTGLPMKPEGKKSLPSQSFSRKKE
jgi:type II secretory pathway pseudopilin PulG